MINTNISEQDVILKEQDLQFAIQQYYNFDLSGLKQEISTTLETETQKINREAQSKQLEIQAKFKDINKLASDHINKGEKYVVGQVDQLDQELLTQYEEHSDKFEQSVRDANTEKQGLREEII